MAGLPPNFSIFTFNNNRVAWSMEKSSESLSSIFKARFAASVFCSLVHVGSVRNFVKPFDFVNSTLDHGI